jgi:hypothetical protein
MLCWLLASGIRIPLASSQHNLYHIYLLLCIQYWTPDDGQKTCSLVLLYENVSCLENFGRSFVPHSAMYAGDIQSMTASQVLVMGRDSSVGIATRYEQDSPGFGSREIPPPPVQTSLGSHPASVTMGTGLFPEVNRTECGVDHPPHVKPRLKKEYNYTSTSPLGLHGLF